MNASADGGDFIPAGPLDAFVESEFVIVDHPSGSVGVVRYEGAFYAVANACPHMGAPLCVGGGVKLTTQASRPFEYDTVQGQPLVRCPWHRWEYSIVDGSNAGNITKTRIRTYPVKVEDGQVYVGRSAKRRQRSEESEAA
jgi:nitrite reductase/ring-hydroxylating ferredoxin subunit